MNYCIITGRLTDDPVIRHTQDGKAVASYTVAVNRPAARQEQKADFIRCVAWEKRAEFAEKYMSKGRKFVVAGRLQTGSYKDKDGKTIYTTELIAQEVDFADSKPETMAAPASGSDGFMTMPDSLDEELPFN